MVYTAKLSPEEIKTAEKTIVEELRTRTAEILKIDPAQVAVRTILPKKDLGYADETWAVSLGTAGDYNDVVNISIPNNKVIYIYGIKIPAKDLDGDISVIEIYKGKELIEVIDLQKGYNGEIYPEFILKKAVSYEPNETLNIKVYVASGVTTPVTKNIIILGYVGERLGEYITSSELQ